VSELKFVGRSIKKKDAFLKVTGRALYTADQRLPHMLTVKVLRSRVPHARLLRVDIARAERLPGVKKVLTHKTAPGVRYNSYWREPVDDERLPADEMVFSPVVRHVGDRIAAVAAIDAETAEEALQLIGVEYEELPVVGDPEEALRPGAPLVHGEGNPFYPGSNLIKHVEWTRGDVEEGFSQADAIFEDVFETHVVQHTPMETHTYAADFDLSSGRLTVWTSTQGVHNIRVLLGKILEMPLTRLRVINR
jgi:CO/xanthine dehydrogenase Mo-binding subunit